MKWWRGRDWLAAAGVIGCVSCGGDAPVPAAPAEAPEATVAKKIAEVPPKKEGLQAISKILAPGRIHRGVTYPVFEDGVLKTVLTAEEMVRDNDEELDLTDLVIETFGADREPDYRIDMRSATYYLASEELTSDEETVVTGRTFTIRGDRMIYRSEGGVAQLEGNIRMVISDVKSFSATQGAGDASAGAAAEKDEPTETTTE